MPPDRSAGRDVHLYDVRNPTITLGGLVVTNGITNKSLYFILDILLICHGPFVVQDEGGVPIEKDDHPLQPGKYYINGKSKLLYSVING